MFDFLKSWSRPKDYGMGTLMGEMQREADLRAQGWVSFVNPPHYAPRPFGKVIDIIDRNGDIITMPYDDIHPMWNVAGKFWRESIFMQPGKTIEGSLSPTRPASIRERPLAE